MRDPEWEICDAVLLGEDVSSTQASPRKVPNDGELKDEAEMACHTVEESGSPARNTGVGVAESHMTVVSDKTLNPYSDETHRSQRPD